MNIQTLGSDQRMSFSHRSSHYEQERRSSSSAVMLPEPSLVVGPVSGVGCFYKHQSCYRTEKADHLGRHSRVEATRYEKKDAEGRHLETVRHSSLPSMTAFLVFHVFHFRLTRNLFLLEPQSAKLKNRISQISFNSNCTNSEIGYSLFCCLRFKQNVFDGSFCLLLRMTRCY